MGVGDAATQAVAQVVYAQSSHPPWGRSKTTRFVPLVPCTERANLPRLRQRDLWHGPWQRHRERSCGLAFLVMKHFASPRIFSKSRRCFFRDSSLF